MKTLRILAAALVAVAAAACGSDPVVPGAESRQTTTVQRQTPDASFGNRTLPAPTATQHPSGNGEGEGPGKTPARSPYFGSGAGVASAGGGVTVTVQVNP